MQRRDLLKIAGVGFLVSTPLSAGPIDTLRFRRAYRAALRRQLLDGKITPTQHRRYWLAAMNFEPFEDEGRTDTFIGHLERRCTRIAQDLGEDITDWWNRAVSWLVENWSTVLQVLLGLILLLETPE